MLLGSFTKMLSYYDSYNKRLKDSTSVKMLQLHAMIKIVDSCLIIAMKDLPKRSFLSC